MFVHVLRIIASNSKKFNAKQKRTFPKNIPDSLKISINDYIANFHESIAYHDVDMEFAILL